MPQTYKSGDDITHLMNASTPTKTFKSGDDITNLMNRTPEPEPEVPPEYTGPDTFMEGVLNSGPEVLDAMGSSALGYLKGATLDIPSSLYHGAKNAVMHPIDTLLSSMGPLGDVISGKDSMAPIREASANAGAQPEAFGRIAGQLAGQPAVTGGIISGAPSAVRAAGTPIAATGRAMKNYQPISGILPGMLEPRLARIAESMAGRGIEAIGNRMRRPAPVPPLEGELVLPETDIMEGNFRPVPSHAGELPPSNTSFYAPERNLIPPQELPPAPDMMGLPPSNVHYAEPSSLRVPTQLEGMPNQRQLPPSNVHYQGPSPIDSKLEYTGRSLAEPEIKPKMRMNSEGNIADLSTGQVLEPSGKVMSFPSKISEIMQKSFTDMTFDELMQLNKLNLDANVMKTVKRELSKRMEPARNSPFFLKNRK